MPWEGDVSSTDRSARAPAGSRKRVPFGSSSGRHRALRRLADLVRLAKGLCVVTGTDPLGRLVELTGVFEAVEAARGSVDALLRDLRGRELRRRVTEVTAESLRRAAWASTCLELDEPWDLDTFTPPFDETERGRTARGALRVTTELAGLAGVWRTAPLQALARLHSLAAADLVAAGELLEVEVGRPRAGADGGGRMSGLAEVLAAPTVAPAVLVAAVVQGELESVGPFRWGNGLVARAAARLVLLERGLDPRAASIPEVGFLELGRVAHDSALAAYVSGSGEGVAQWLVHCAQAVALGGRAGRDVAAAVRG